MAAIAKIVSVVTGTVACLWVAIGVTLTLTIGRSDQELALRWWPWGAMPKAALAAGIVSDEKASADALKRAEQLAKEALRREPVNVEAVRTLGLLHARRGDARTADLLFAHSESLSRRDLPTQLWLIEKAVRENNVRGALRHYDRALRTSRSAPDLLLPTLVAASDDPAIAAPLAKILAPRPNWWRQFLALAARDVADSRALVIFGRSLKLDLREPNDANLARAILDRLIKDKNYSEAFTYYAELTTSSATRAAGLRDGGFEEPPGRLPFDWWMEDEPNLSASKEVFGSDDTRLVLRASGGRGGMVARQLLVLSPGQYRISGKAGDTGKERLAQPTITIRCLDKPVVATARLPGTDSTAVPFRFDFTIPAEDCRAQWLAIETAPAADTEAWIDDIAIQKR